MTPEQLQYSCSAISTASHTVGTWKKHVLSFWNWMFITRSWSQHGSLVYMWIWLFQSFGSRNLFKTVKKCLEKLRVVFCCEGKILLPLWWPHFSISASWHLPKKVNFEPWSEKSWRVQKRTWIAICMNAYKGNATFPEGPAPSSLEPPKIII